MKHSSVNSCGVVKHSSVNSCSVVKHSSVNICCAFCWTPQFLSWRCCDFCPSDLFSQDLHTQSPLDACCRTLYTCTEHGCVLCQRWHSVGCSVSLEDLYKGKTAKLQLSKTVMCMKCNGYVSVSTVCRLRMYGACGNEGAGHAACGDEGVGNVAK